MLSSVCVGVALEAWCSAENLGGCRNRVILGPWGEQKFGENPRKTGDKCGHLLTMVRCKNGNSKRIDDRICMRVVATRVILRALSLETIVNP